MKVFIIAGEPSGDRLGGALMAGLKSLRPDITFDGIGGTDMAAEGLTSRFDMSELSVMGIAEILPKYKSLMARINETAQAVIEAKPDVMITIDSPDFSLRVAKRVKAASDIRTVHYVAPTVWAWRPGRAKKMARYIDHVLALFPFEPPLMEAEGMACDFVGHPVVGEKIATHREAAAFRQAHEIGDAPLMLVLPGSRRSEVARLSDVFGDAVARFARRWSCGRRGDCADPGLDGAPHRAGPACGQQGGRCRDETGGFCRRGRGPCGLWHRVAGTGRGIPADGDRLPDELAQLPSDQGDGAD